MSKGKIREVRQFISPTDYDGEKYLTLTPLFLGHNVVLIGTKS